jgi:hypothetical protein
MLPPQVLQFMTETQADLVLTPQFFSNTEPGADIFNNDNIQFWKVRRRPLQTHHHHHHGRLS